MKFYCYEYSGNYSARSRNVMGNASTSSATQANQETTASTIMGGTLLGSVYVPAPPELSIYTDAAYNTRVNDPSTLTQANPGGGFNPLAPLEEGVLKAINLMAGGVIDLDLSDATFQGVNKRVYTFKLMMPAWTSKDAEAASDICNFFQAYQLPTVGTPIAESLGYATKAYHPAMWIFGIGKGDNQGIDSDWLGDPQLCVMDGLNVNKTAFKNNYGISIPGGSIKPLSQSATISFVEIEPAFRASSRSVGRNDIPRIISRSTAWAGEDSGI
jgi:hypothetical protein